MDMCSNTIIINNRIWSLKTDGLEDFRDLLGRPSIGRAYQWAHPERAWMGLGAEAISGGWPGEKDFQVNRNRYLNWPTYQYIPQLKYIYVIHINLSTYHMPKWHLNYESSLKWCVVPSPGSSCNCSLENDSHAKDSVSTQSWFFKKKGGYIHILSHSLPIQGPKSCIKIVITLGIFQVKMEELQLELEETQRQLDQVKACQLDPFRSLTAKKRANGLEGKMLWSDLM